jgi:hypothetical protein
MVMAHFALLPSFWSARTQSTNAEDCLHAGAHSELHFGIVRMDEWKFMALAEPVSSFSNGNILMESASDKGQVILK